MTYQPFPESVIETPYGRLRVWATSATHVGFSTKGNINVEPKEGEADNFVLVNRVPYTFRVDLHPVEAEPFEGHDGTEAVRYVYTESGQRKVSVLDVPGWGCDYNGITATKQNASSYNASYPSAAAWKKLHDIGRWCVSWIASQDGQALVAAATERARQQRVEAIAERLEAIEAERAALDDERRALLSEKILAGTPEPEPAH